MNIHHERIQERAYALWVEEGRIHGRDNDYWFRAERELNYAGKASPNAAGEESSQPEARGGQAGRLRPDLPDDFDQGSRPDPRREPRDRPRAERDAAFGRRQAWLRAMQEDRAAPAFADRAPIAGEVDDDIIELVLPAHALVAGRVGQPDGAVVIAVARRVAPAVATVDPAHDQPRRRPPHAVRPIE